MTAIEMEPVNQYKAVNRKPKLNRKGGALDNCYTPPHAILPLLPFLASNQIIWESAPGEKFMVDAFIDHDRAVVYDGERDFFEWEPPYWDVQITNPPYSQKFAWLRHSYKLGKPFALLLPVEALGAKQGNMLIAEYGGQFILFTKRINFHMPQTGYENKGAQFPVLWWTWQLGLDKQIKVWNNQLETFMD